MPTQEESNVTAFETLIKVAAHGGPVLPENRTFSLARVEPISKEWYFCADCPHCFLTTPAFRDFSQGKLDNPFSGTGGVRLICRNCQKPYSSPFLQLVPYQWE